MNKPKILIDSNCFNIFFFANSREDRIIKKSILKKFQIIHNVVTLVEVSRNSRLKQSKRNYIHNELLNKENIVIPDLEDWKLSLYLILDYKNKKKPAQKTALRKMQMDCLLASMAINKKIYIFTNDLDFEYLQTFKKGKNLKIILKSSI